MSEDYPPDYQSPLSLKDLQEIFLGLFDDALDAKEYLKGLQRQRPGQSLQWHLAAGIHLMMLRRRYDPNKRKSLVSQQIIADKAVTFFDKPKSLE